MKTTTKRQRKHKCNQCTHGYFVCGGENYLGQFAICDRKFQWIGEPNSSSFTFKLNEMTIPKHRCKELERRRKKWK